MNPIVPVESILDASLTVSPQMSNTGFVAPITPHTSGPMLTPKREMKTCIVCGLFFFISLVCVSVVRLRKTEGRGKGGESGGSVADKQEATVAKWDWIWWPASQPDRPSAPAPDQCE